MFLANLFHVIYCFILAGVNKVIRMANACLCAFLTMVFHGATMKYLEYRTRTFERGWLFFASKERFA